MELSLNKTPKNSIWIEELLNNLANAEMSRDLNQFEKLFRPYWDQVENEPNFRDFLEIEQAFLYRYAGSFLCHYGKAKARADYQERGKDFLSYASDIFIQNDLIDMYYESQIILAYSYYYENRGGELEAILTSVESNYEADKSHDNYLLCKVNHLEWLKDNDLPSAKKCVDELEPLIKKNSNLKLHTQFHTQTGITLRRLGIENFEKALFHYELGINYAREIKNKRFEANLFNNLSFLYLHWKKYKLAHLKVDEAIRLGEKLGDIGWLAEYFDTKANIFFAQQEYENALDSINKSIIFFMQGEHFSGYCEALFLKTKLYYHFDYREEANEYFIQIIQLAYQKISEQKALYYLREFMKLAYFPAGDSYQEKVKNYKGYLLENALQKSNGVASEAARELSLLPGTMSEILRNQFPELLKDLDMKKERNPRTGKAHSLPKITRFLIAKQFRLPEVNSEKPYFFQIPEAISSKYLGLMENLIIAIIPVSSVRQNDLFLYKKDKNYQIGIIIYDSGRWLIRGFDEDCSFNLSEIKLLGKIIGKLPVKNLEKDKIEFSRV